MIVSTDSSRKVIKVREMFDGTLAPPTEGAAIVISDGSIEAVATHADVDAFAARGYDVIDASHLCAVPGLIDSHVHLCLPGDGTPAEDHMSRTEGEIVLTAARNALTALMAGITTVRDCGGPPGALFSVRRAIESGLLIEGPDLLLCGSSLTVTGGHTWFFGGEVDTMDEVVKRVRLLRKLGADFVKLIATGGGTRGVIQHAQMLTDGQMRAASREARRLGIYSTAHVCTTETIRSALRAGVDMFEHLIWADEHGELAFDGALAERIAARGIPICHTMSALFVAIKKLESKDEPLTQREATELEMLKRFNDTITLGFERTCQTLSYIPATDAGWRSSAFGSLVDSMMPMAEYGMTNAQVLHSATALAAKHIRARGVGTLAPGMRADILLVSGSPIESLEHLRAPCAVFKNGRQVLISPIR